MKKVQNTENFFVASLNPEQFPFLTLWILKEQNNIMRAELKVLRKGLPKAGPHPMVRHKKFLALAKAFMKFKLKDFAEAFDLSYGVVRLWNREQRVIEQANKYFKSFAIAYVLELEKLSLSKKLDLEKYSFKTVKKAQEKITSHLYEAQYYNSKIQKFIFYLMKVKIEVATQEISRLWAIHCYRYGSILSKNNILNPPKDRKERELLEFETKKEGEFMQQLMTSSFSGLKGCIKKGNVKTAQRIADFIENQFLIVNGAYYDLQVKMINVGKKGKQRKSAN